jgi:cytochrome c-type biogenesis protein
MIEKVFETLTYLLSGNFQIALIAALGWGILSILLSPCHMTSIPLIIGYLGSQGQIKIKRSFYLSITFAVGILITIAIIGIITASMSRLLGDVGSWGNILVAVVFIFVGLYLMDIVHWTWFGFDPGRTKRGGIWGALILGLIFGIGLGPCTFAFLAPVLGVVFQTANDSLLKAILLISAFGVGHCAVIVMAGCVSNLVQTYMNWIQESKAQQYIKRAAGLLVIFGGIYFIYTTF